MSLIPFQLTTPYYYSVTHLATNECAEEYNTNFTEYHLFCLKKHLQLYLAKQIPAASLEFPGKIEDNAKIWITVRISVGMQLVDLTEKELKELQEIITQVTAKNPPKLPLISADLEIYYPRGNYFIETSWIRTILPYLDIDPHLNPFLENATIYLDLSGEVDFKTSFFQLYDKVRKQLYQYYLAGVIVTDALFAKEWQLEPLVLRAENEDDIGLYQPRWHDERITQDRVSFLLDRMMGIDEYFITYLGKSYFVRKKSLEEIRKLLDDFTETTF